MQKETGFSSVLLKPFSVVVVLEGMEQTAECYPPIRKNQPPGNRFDEEYHTWRQNHEMIFMISAKKLAS